MNSGHTQTGPWLRPTSDLGFKKILASEDHKTITQGFIKDFFGLQVGLDDIHIVNPYSIHTIEEIEDGVATQKLQQTLRDITIQVDTADLAVEMQVRKEGHFIRRAMYYLDDLYVSHYNHQQHRYMDLRPVWSMNLTGHQLFDDQRALHMFSYRDDLTSEQLAPVLKRLGFFELTKTETTTPMLSRWRDFLLTGDAQDDDPAYICSAADIIRWVNLSQKERDMDKVLEKAIATQEAIIDYAREEGIAQGMELGRTEGMELGRAEGIEQGIEKGMEQGIQQGREEGITQGIEKGMERGAREAQLASARVALKMGMKHTDVAEITGLDLAAIDQLAQE